ncbi:EAL domain-containing protein [Phenylobacterium sp.]|uniref:sensor domain-containing phosphodiesterase n=1 Tax=Phenylobacterium sp. TaxID=1871053 RepID=UPI00286B408D|nr:EAL domain-containing protein [Phenylobacterium sp.]
MSVSPDARAAALKLQLLGLAFAGADLVFEVNAVGTVTFALGAVEQLAGRPATEFIGSNWTDLVGEGDTDLLSTLIEGLGAGERQGPLRVALASRPPRRLVRHGSLSVFKLPQRTGQISCALSLGAPAAIDQITRGSDGLLHKDSFTSTVAVLLSEAERAGLPVRLDLVELGGLDAAVSGMDAATADRTRRRVAATLRAESFAGVGASEVATDRFALVRPATASTDKLCERLKQASGGQIVAAMAELALDADSPAQNLRAMRYALDRYIEDGPAGAQAGFSATIERTVRDTSRFKAMLASGDFHLAYQPVVSLDGRHLHHFEALARFDPNSSPADTIRLAEELALIADFDLAVARCVAKALFAGAPELKIAVNVSAASLMRQGFVEALLEVTAFDSSIRSRLLFEITETQRISDLPDANLKIAALRAAGHVICLDDFGAGAASLDYLRFLDVDVVKIDGRYIQALDSRPRDVLVLKHVIALCRDLGVTTIAEMVETAQIARLTQELGVELGQGWYFGKPLPEPKWSTPPVTAPARRVGSTEQWG